MKYIRYDELLLTINVILLLSCFVIDTDSHRYTEVGPVVTVTSCRETSRPVLTVCCGYSLTDADILRSDRSLVSMCVLCGGLHREEIIT